MTVAPARTNLIVTLVGVAFADGGAASGSFALNQYGYIASANIVTTPGTSINNVALPGYTYPTIGAGTDNGAADAFGLKLEARFALTSSITPPPVAGRRIWMAAS